MPAAEETYRRQSSLHIVFAVTSIAMMGSVVWMILADHLRPWKQVQRDFHQVETAKLKAVEAKKKVDLDTAHKAEIDKIDAEIAAADKQAAANAKLVRAKEAQISKATGEIDRSDTAKKFQKAELDSQRSFYDGMIDRDERAQAAKYIQEAIVPSEQRLTKLTNTYEAAQGKLAAHKDELKGLKGNVEAKVKRKEDLERDYSNAQRVLAQKREQYNGLFAPLRGIPFLDLAAPPTKIQQISLPDLTINYNFKDVPRYDRCLTCHMGIDKLGYEVSEDGKTAMKDKHPAFAAHPYLTTGAMTVDPKGNPVAAGLYLDSNGPHPINSYGCTICHAGQGSGTSFTYSSHEPNTLEQKADWTKEYGYEEIHHWDEPMLPARFMESSCIKCHHDVTDVPQAKKLQAGYDRITKYGCTGCHTIGGEGSFGPDLTDNRAVGPNLKHIASKVSKEWAAKWIKNPHSFRPDTRMPRFYDVTNNSAPEDQKKVNAEVHAITHYLFAVSTPPKDFVEAPKAGNAESGKALFLQKGCLACHAHKEMAPEGFPEEVRDYAKANYGPNLSNMAIKFQSAEQGQGWLANWIMSPEAYHPKSLMPNLQLSMAESADIAAWVLSVPAKWEKAVDVPPLDSPEVKQGLDELVELYISKAKTYKKKSVLLSEVKGLVAKGMSTDEKLMYVGEKTISRLGCFGCHNISGYETAKPIGTPMNGWGAKSPTKLDYGHIAEYLVDQKESPDKKRDGTDEYYQEKLEEHTRSGFLYQKLHRPRSYDYKKTKDDLKSWDDRLRMPQFAWADDEKAVEEVMTFILGLTGEKIAAKYLARTHYNPAQKAIAQGEKLLDRYNCKGCHVVGMPKYTVAMGTKVEKALPDFQTNLEVSYADRAKDYLAAEFGQKGEVHGFYPGLKYDAENVPKPAADSDARPAITIEGMPVGMQVEDGDDGKPIKRLAVQLWKPATILGYTFNAGDKVVLDPDKVSKVEPDGGNFAWLSAANAAKEGADYASSWNRLPPPLLREGQKVQTPWLTNFFKDPYMIRPAAQLRMPRFHYGSSLGEMGPMAGKPAPSEADALAQKLKANVEAQGETRDLANYWAARDGAEFPYQDIPERERAYLADRQKQHAEYLAGGWQIITKGLCVSCHNIGQYKVGGGAGDKVVNGPDLRQVGGRFRPEYLAEWLANPARLVPYTAMPQNISPHVPAGSPVPPYVPKSFEGKQLDQVAAMRDVLLNYTTVVEDQLAKGAAEGASKPAAPPAAGGED